MGPWNPLTDPWTHPKDPWVSLDLTLTPSRLWPFQSFQCLLSLRGSSCTDMAFGCEKPGLSLKCRGSEVNPRQLAPTQDEQYKIMCHVDLDREILSKDKR